MSRPIPERFATWAPPGLVSDLSYYRHLPARLYRQRRRRPTKEQEPRSLLAQPTEKCAVDRPTTSWRTNRLWPLRRW